MGLLIRNARLQDFDALITLALEEAERCHPELRPSRERMYEMFKYLVSSSSCYAKVAEDEDTGDVVGALLAIVQDNSWAERKFASVMFWVSRAADSGVRLLRDFLAWVKSRRVIRFAGMSPDFDWDERISCLLQRMGFEKRGGSFVYIN